MAGKGGARPGAGRKTKAEELRVRDIAIDSITELHGGLKEGFIHLLRSEEPALIKFVYEHAAGKPKDTLDVDIKGKIKPIQIIQLPDNGRSNTADKSA